MTAAAAVVLIGAVAWACMCNPIIKLSTISAKGGQEIAVLGGGFDASSLDTIFIRFNSLDGPVLTTVPGPLAGGNLSTTIRIPDETKPGSYVLFITRQDVSGHLTLNPTRASLTVVGETGANPIVGAAPSVDTTARASTLERSSRFSMAALVLVAMGTAGFGMLLAGTAAAFSGGRRPAPETASLRS
jgi:hypothetical protein